MCALPFHEKATDSVTQPALSPDGRMVAFIRGGGTFLDRGQIYVKFLPDGQQVQLTHDNLLKMSPTFSRRRGRRAAHSYGVIGNSKVIRLTRYSSEFGDSLSE
jgi:hypothetical protein